MVYVIFWRVEMVGWRFMPYIIFFIYLIIYKRILACSTSTVYKSPGFFSSFSLIFFLKQLGATEKKKKVKVSEACTRCMVLQMARKSYPYCSLEACSWNNTLRRRLLQQVAHGHIAQSMWHPRRVSTLPWGWSRRHPLTSA